jgi:hypothetical protein
VAFSSTTCLDFQQYVCEFCQNIRQVASDVFSGLMIVPAESHGAEMEPPGRQGRCAESYDLCLIPLGDLGGLAVQSPFIPGRIGIGLQFILVGIVDPSIPPQRRIAASNVAVAPSPITQRRPCSTRLRFVSPFGSGLRGKFLIARAASLGCGVCSFS